MMFTPFWFHLNKYNITNKLHTFNSHIYYSPDIYIKRLSTLSICSPPPISQHNLLTPLVVLAHPYTFPRALPSLYTLSLISSCSSIKSLTISKNSPNCVFKYVLMYLLKTIMFTCVLSLCFRFVLFVFLVGFGHARHPHSTSCVV